MMRQSALAWMAAGLYALASMNVQGADLPPDQAEEVDRIASEFSKATGLPSLSVGIVDRDGLCHSFSTGLAEVQIGTAATSDTLYRVGSLTKVFTATLLVQLRDAGEVALDDPLVSFLPDGTKSPTDPRGAPLITLRHLAQHTSGLPRLPPGAYNAPASDPYGSITGDSLITDLQRTRLESPIGARFSYSNFGTALLGLSLGRAGGDSYEALLAERILHPLGMNDSGFAPSQETATRWTKGYASQSDEPVADWTMSAINPTGGLCSSVNDLAKFVAMNLRAGEVDAPVIRAGTLAEMQTPTRMTGESWVEAVGLGWIVRHRAGGDVVWHNGMTGNHASAVFMIPSRDIGVICLTNAAKDIDGLAWNLLEALTNRGADTPAAVLVPEEVAVAAKQLVASLGAPAEADLAALFAPAFLEQVPESRVRGILSMLNSAFGAHKSHTLAPAKAPPGAWTATVQMERGAVALHFMLEPVEGGRVVYFMAKPL